MVSCGRVVFDIRISHQYRAINGEENKEELPLSESRSADKENGKLIDISSTIDKKSFEMAGYHIHPELSGRIHSDLKTMVSRQSAIFSLLMSQENHDTDEGGNTVEISWSESSSSDKDSSGTSHSGSTTGKQFNGYGNESSPNMDETSSVSSLSGVFPPDQLRSRRRRNSIEEEWPQSTFLDTKNMTSVCNANESKSSKMAGDRLYRQAKESERKKAMVRAKYIASETGAGRLSLATDQKNKRVGGKMKKSTEKTDRLCEIYEMGKSKILLDRERFKKKQEEKLKLAKASLVLPKRNNRYEPKNRMLVPSKGNLDSTPSIEREKRLCEMYERGKNRIRDDRERSKKQRAGCEKKITLKSPTKSIKHDLQDGLFTISEEKEVFGKHRRKQFEQVNKLVRRPGTRFKVVRSLDEAMTNSCNNTQQRLQLYKREKFTSNKKTHKKEPKNKKMLEISSDGIHSKSTKEDKKVLSTRN